MNRKHFTLFFMLLPFWLLAQEKFDRVFFSNGDVFTGKVTAVEGDSISFVHKGETLVYRFARNGIGRIEFASGRVEEMSAGSQNTAAVKGDALPEKNPRLVAVLPFRIAQNREQDPEAPFLIQQEYFKQAVARGNGQYQDPNTTNALLLRKGIDIQQLRGYTMDELCQLLGVGFVVQGQATLHMSGAKVTTSNHNSNRPSGNKPGSGSTSTSSSTTSMRNSYETTISISVYDDHGKLLFNKDKKSILNSAEAYRATIGYLVKRMPQF